MTGIDRDLDGIEAVFLDLDGTLYLGDQLIEGALDFLARLEVSGTRRFFLSNNSSRSVDQYVEKLRGMGVPASAEDVILSTHDLLSWLDSNGVSETYLVGTAGMQHMLEGAGVSTDSADPQYVVLGTTPKSPTRNSARLRFTSTRGSRWSRAIPTQSAPRRMAGCLTPGPTWISSKPPRACLLYTSPSPRDRSLSRMPSSA